MIAIGAVLMLAGIGVYHYVGQLTIVQQVSSISIKNFMMAEVKMLAVIILALDRLSLARATYRMASFIRKGEG